MTFLRFAARAKAALGLNAFLAALAVGVLGADAAQAQVTLLNVSYDPTRELYQEFNKAFAAQWKAKTGETVKIKQSHGGSGKQARSVIDGLEADVVTLALAYDIDAIAERGKSLPPDWQKRLPHNSTPYTSTIVFLVRKGNPKGIKDWDDLAKPGVSVITPNPKTSGGAQWNYLAAWEFAQAQVRRRRQGQGVRRQSLQERAGAGHRRARLDATFVERGIGDVLISWENEAFLAIKALGPERFQIVCRRSASSPSRRSRWSTRSWTRGARARWPRPTSSTSTREEGQEIAAKNFYRPPLEKVAQKYAAPVPEGHALHDREVFGGWKKAPKTHFADGGIFDQIYTKGHERNRDAPVAFIPSGYNESRNASFEPRCAASIIGVIEPEGLLMTRPGESRGASLWMPAFADISDEP